LLPLGTWTVIVLSESSSSSIKIVYGYPVLQKLTVLSCHGFTPRGPDSGREIQLASQRGMTQMQTLAGEP
jgi:hypothetical protein